jgi:hypothetical protein
MPKNIIKSFSEKTGKSEQEVEKLWNKSSERCGDNDYQCIVGILKRMLGLNESFRDFLKRI